MSNQSQTGPIDIDRIRELVPHAGKMCLLERVLEYNDLSIRCETISHLDPDNPLRYKGHLSGICGIEYAAQAMALHGTLKSPQASPHPEQTAGPAATSVRHGYLASVRDVCCSARYLDAFATPLIVGAELVFEDSSRVIYSFTIEAGDTELITGRAAVVLA